MVHGDSVWVRLASTTTAKPAMKYQAPASATRARQRADGSENAERHQDLPQARQQPQRLAARTSTSPPRAARRRRRRAGTARPPGGSWHRRGPDDDGASARASRCRSSGRRAPRRRTSRRRSRAARCGIAEQPELQDRGQQRDARRSRRSSPDRSRGTPCRAAIWLRIATMSASALSRSRIGNAKTPLRPIVRDRPPRHFVPQSI